MKQALRVVLPILQRVWQRAKQHPRVQEVLYANRNLFSDIDQHERMLADDVRVNTYHAAIHKHIGAGKTVVDLGTGTGILAFFASQRNPNRVYAIDHGDIIQLARYIAAQNGIGSVEFVETHSAEFTPPEKVDVILYEQIGDFLLDEDMVRNVCDLRDRILKPGGKILPSQFSLFFEPLCLNERRRIPYLWEQTLHGIRFTAAKAFLESEHNPLTRSLLYHRVCPGDASHFLCEPKSMIDFDLMTIDPAAFPRRFSMTKQVTRAGVMDGICIYFHARFDSEHAILAGPLDTPTRHSLQWLPQLFRTEPIQCKAGDTIHLDIEIPDHSRVETWKIEHRITQAVAEPVPANLNVA
jgi:type I protein arginine methyltransferase